jgi:hypothetical protein
MQEGDQQIMLFTHVDDSFCHGKQRDCPHKLPQQALLRKFDGTSDMDAKEYVGMDWERDIEGHTRKLHQSAFCEKLLKRCKKMSDTGSAQSRQRHCTVTSRYEIVHDDSTEVTDPALHRRYSDRS